MANYISGDAPNPTGPSDPEYPPGGWGPAFVTVWSFPTDGESLLLPLGYYTAETAWNFTVDWGDGSSDTITNYNDAATTHVYTLAGEYIVNITGVYPHFDLHNDFSEHVNQNNLLRVLSLGQVQMESLTGSFGAAHNLTSIVAGDSDLSLVTDMDYCFYECTSLVSVDFSGANLSNITSMVEVFYTCPVLDGSGIDFSGVDFSGVIDMRGFFYRCYALTQIPLMLTTSNVTQWTDFVGETAITSFGFDNISTASAQRMSGMFRKCTELTNVVFSVATTALVTDISYMFDQCTSFVNTNNGGMNFTGVTNVSYMFRGCTALTQIIFGDWGFGPGAGITNMRGMFLNCETITSIQVGDANTSAVTTMQAAFSNCYLLTDLDLTKVEINSCTTMVDMLLGSNSYTSSQYEDALVNWDAVGISNRQSGVVAGFGLVKYTPTALTAKSNLESQSGWTILDGGPV